MVRPIFFRKQDADDVLGSGARMIIYTVFFASGATALIYEVTWMRIFALILGSTTLAATLILAAFFSGLALGAWLLGRLIDRFGAALIIYSLIEISLGIYALFSIQLFKSVDTFCLLIFGDSSEANTFGIFQFIFLWGTLLLPTALMGGTLPVISKYLARRLDTSGRVVGRLYAVNTLGAVVGTVLSAFFMIRIWGISKAITLSASLNITLGLIIFVLRTLRLIMPFNLNESKEVETEVFARKSHKLKKSEPEFLAFATEDSFRILILLIVFVSGFTSLAGEVLWLRIFSISLDSSIQSFGIVLSIFLGGFALGSFVFSRVADKSRQPLFWLSGFFMISALILAIAIPFLDRLPLIYFQLIQNYASGWLASIFVKYGLAIFILLPLTFFMGGVFPVAIRLFSTQIRFMGGSVGTLYAWNTIGGILGSILAGLFFIPVLGTRIGFIVVCCLMGIVGYLTFFFASPYKSPSIRLAPVGILLIIISYSIISGPWKPERMIVWWGGKELNNSDILYYKEGLEGNVAVVRHGNANSLFVGKKLIAADDPETQRHLGLLSHIPLLLHPQPRKVLVIGLATGITLNAALKHHVEKAECVDINPLMEEAALFFKVANQDVMKNPRADITIVDARHYIRKKEGYFDCITTDPIHPADANSNNLYSLEFYQMAACALKSDGIMCQWLPAADLNPKEVKRIVGTFSTAFKYVSLWIPNLSDLALIGSNEPLELDIDRIQERLRDEKTVKGVSRHLGEATVENFLSLFALGTNSIQKFSEGIPLNTDNRPILEYEAPKNLWNPANLPNLYFEIISNWSNSFNELVEMIESENTDSSMIEKVKERYFAQRNQNLMLVARSLGMWCLELEERGKLREALSQYERMFSLFPETLNPHLLDACIGMSVIYEKLGNHKKAGEFYHAAITMAPSESESRNLVGQAFAARQLYSRAEREWKRVLEKEPSNQEARYHLEWLKIHRQNKGIIDE